MEDLVKKDIIKILNEAIGAIEENRFIDLMKISNHTIHNASIFQDEYSITVAVILYSLYKISNEIDEVDPEIIYLLRKAKDDLEKGEESDFCDKISDITNRIKQASKKMSLYLQEVITRAQIKKGSKLYYHGLSLARAAELLNISQWELMNYVGKTSINDYGYIVSENLKEKRDFIREIFNLK